MGKKISKKQTKIISHGVTPLDTKLSNWGIPKPWGQKEHDQFMKESGMTEEEHKAYHEEHGGWHGKNKDEEQS